VVFHERDIEFSVSGVPAGSRLGLIFEWVPERSALQNVSADQLNYRFRDFDYSVRVAGGTASKTGNGAHIVASGQGALRLQMAQ